MGPRGRGAGLMLGGGGSWCPVFLVTLRAGVGGANARALGRGGAGEGGVALGQRSAWHGLHGQAGRRPARCWVAEGACQLQSQVGITGGGEFKV